MKSKIVRLHGFNPITVVAGLATPLQKALPRTYAYISLLIQAVVTGDAAVAAPTRTEDGQHRTAFGYRIRRDGGTPVNVLSRAFGHLAQYLHGVEDDVQETAPLAIGANVLEHWTEIPFVDPMAAFGSPAWAESLLIAWRRRTLDLEVQPFAGIEEVFTAGGGGTIALTSVVYNVFAKVLVDATAEEVEAMGGLSKELRFKSRVEPTVAAVAQAYSPYLNDDMDRDVRVLRFGMMGLDGDARSPDLLTESTVKVMDDFVLPENMATNGVKALNVWNRRVDLPDGVDILELDQNRDHVSAPFAPDAADLRIWRQTAAPVAAGSLQTVQMSVGEAEYPS
jgi:hypothetical protein